MPPTSIGSVTGRVPSIAPTPAGYPTAAVQAAPDALTAAAPAAVTAATPSTTVGSALGAFTDPPSAAEMAALRTFVNALKTDDAAIKAELVKLVTDITAARAEVVKLVADITALRSTVAGTLTKLKAPGIMLSA